MALGGTRWQSVAITLNRPLAQSSVPSPPRHTIRSTRCESVCNSISHPSGGVKSSVAQVCSCSSEPFISLNTAGSTMRVAIGPAREHRCTPISKRACVMRGYPMRGHQGQPKDNQGQSRAIKGNRGPSKAIEDHQGQSRASRGNHLRDVR